MTTASILSLAQNDHGLSAQEKEHLEQVIQDRDIQKFLSGAAGATLSVIAAKYMKLGRTAQFLLGLAGYGLGRIVYDYLVSNKHRYRQFARYNDKMKAYEVDTSRY